MADQTYTLEELAAMQSQSAAAPAGLQQQAAAGGQTNENTIEGLAAQAGIGQSSTSWFTGANTEGTDNGWDSTFSQQFVEGANKAMEEGTLDKYYESKEAGAGTGVVLFDMTSSNGTELKLGDIYENGEKTGNVYEQFDKDTANKMLAAWMFDGSEQAEMYSKSDPMQALDAGVRERATADSEGWKLNIQRQAFEGEVDTNTAEFQEGVGDEALAGAAGLATGAMATGAAVSATGVGIIPGAIIFAGGAIIGGTAAYLNRDALSEAAGRAYTITSMSREEFGLPAAIGTGIEQWSGVAGKTITPFGNLVEGSFDVIHGEAGDGTSEFYRIDASTGGESQVGGWWKAAHLAAAVGDAGLQFASPIGVQMFTAQMTGVIGGQVGQLAGSGGSTFDYNTAAFDNIFTDDSGSFDPLSAAAGIGKIGVDALQLGFARGLAGKVDSSLANVGEEAVYAGSRGFSILRPFRTAEQRQIIKDGGSAEIMAGREFFKDASGQVVAQRKTIQLLAPSESVMFMNTRIRALREARLRGGDGIDVEDYYAAARSLTQGERKVNTVLVNAFGEGYEEGIQGVLEPLSHNDSITWSSVAEQFAYGAAMGGGMGGAAAFNMASQAQKDFALAKAGWALAERGELTRETWEGMSSLEKQNVVNLGNLKNQQLKAAGEQVIKDQTATEMATVQGRDKLLDAARKEAAAEAKRAVPGNPDQAITIVALDDASFRADAVTSSSIQLGISLDNRLNGFNLHLQTLERELEEAKVAAAEGGPDADLSEIARIEAELAKTENVLRMGILLRGQIEKHVERASTITDFAAMEAEAELINDILRAAFDRELTEFGGEALTADDKLALAKAVSMVKTRDPQDANRSWQILVPQVDAQLSFRNANGVVGISQTILPAIRGDYDGDKVRDQNQLMLDDEVYTSLRAGQQFYGAGGKPAIGATKSELTNQAKLWTALNMPGSKAGLKMEALRVMMEIGETLRTRYAGVVDPAELEQALGQFLDAVTKGPDKDARQILVSAILAMPSAGALTQWSRQQLSNEPAFIGRLVNQKLQEFQRIYARHTPRDGDMHPTGADVARPETPAREGVQVRTYTEMGLRDTKGALTGTTLNDGIPAVREEYGPTAKPERLVIWINGKVEGYLDYVVTYDENGVSTAHTAAIYITPEGRFATSGVRGYDAVQDFLGATYDRINHGDMTEAGARALAGYVRRGGDMTGHYKDGTLGVAPGDLTDENEIPFVRSLDKMVQTYRSSLPEEMATDVRGQAILPGNVEGASLSAELPGDSIMRLFQQLHYAVNRSNDIDAQDWSDSQYLSQMAQVYSALTSMLTRDVLSEIRGKDEVNARVYAMLQILGRQLQNNTELDGTKAAALIANLRVVDFEIDEDGNIIPGPGGSNITLAQLLLRKELEAWKDRNAAAWDLDPDLQAKYDRLIPITRPPTQRVPGSTAANAERAFVEVMGAQTMYELLGEASEGLGSNLTVEQYVRMLDNLTPAQRKAHAATLRLDENYSNTGKAKTTKITPPYSIEDIANNEIEHATAFRSVVDSIISAANSRSAERESNSKRTSKAFWKGHADIRRILTEYAKEQKTKISRDTLKAMLTNNPVLTRRIYDLIPDSAANLAFPVNANGEVMVAPWVYDMLLTADAQHAEMIYYRNLLLLQWDEARVDALDEGSYADEAKLEFGKLKRRMHQIMWDLRNNHDGGILYAQFLTELEKPNQTVEGFLKWVNDNPSVVGNRAPIVAWYDDVSDFDMNKAGGGWSDELGSSELRTAINAMATTAKGISIVDDIALDERDQDLVDAIGRVVDPNRVATPADQLKYEQLNQRLKEAGRRTMALGPAAMFYQVFAAAKGFYGMAHMKGKNPKHLEGIAAHEALSGQFGYLSDLGRLTAAVTAHTLDAVDGNVSLTINTAGRSVDPETGNVVEWDAFTPEVWLQMMGSPDSRKLARAIVSTQVMERDDDGVMRVKTMHGSSLQDLLDGTSYRDLFEKGENVSQLDMDLRYLSTLDAEAGRFGGHFSVQRALNDFVIARLTAASATVTDAGLERMVVEAMQDFARAMRVAASLPAALDEEMNSLDGNDPIDTVYDDFVKALRTAFQGRKLDMNAQEGITEAAIKTYVAAREQEFDQVMQDLLIEKMADQTEAGALEIQARIEAHERSIERFRARYKELGDNNFIKGLIQEYTIPDVTQDPEGNAAVKQRLIDYVLANQTIRTKVPEASNIANKILANARSEEYGGFMLNVSPEEWQHLATAVVAMRFDTQFTASAPSATITPIPDPTSPLADRIKYYDETFSYLAAPFLDSKHPLLKAARSMQRQSGRHQQVVGREDVIDAVTRNIFRDGSLGAWTSDVPKFSSEAQAGIDSASGIPAISIFGTLSARDQTISRAKARTFDIPGDELLSRVELDWVSLNDKTLTNPIVVTHPTGAVERPIAQLLNRFAKAVTATYVDGEGNEVVIDLLQPEHHVGRIFGADPTAASSGLYEVHPDRILKAVQRLAHRRGVPAAGVRVTVDFFHPDMKPAEPGWYNNLFFEGTSFALDADTARSLPETLNFYEGASNPVGQNRALDSRKKGIVGYFKAKLPKFDQVKQLEEAFETDLSSVIRGKTQLIMETTLGDGELEAEYYNAVYSSMMLRHYVDHVFNGEKVRWTAEQVIAHQLAGGEPLQNARLWIPPDDVLRAMLGGSGPNAAPSIDLEADPASVRTWNGDLSAAVERFPVDPKTVGLADTDLINRQAQRQLKPKARLSEVERRKMDERIAYRQQILRSGIADRAQLPAREAGFNPLKNLQRALYAAGGAVEAEDIKITLQNAGAAFFPPRDRSKLDDSIRVLQKLMGQLPANTTGFVYQHSWPDQQVQADDITGILTQISLDGSAPKGMQVLPGDVVVINTASFRGDYKLGTRVVDHFVKRGAIVVLGEGTGRTNMRADLGNYLESQQYGRVGGSVHVFQPLDTTSRYRNVASKLSTLTSWGPVAAQSRLGVLQVLDLNVEENTMWVDPADEKLNSIAETINVFQGDVYGGFNVPTPNMAESVIQKVRALNTPEGRDFIVRHSTSHIKSKSRRRKLAEETLEMFDEMIDRFDADETTVLPRRGDTFGTGYFIPLVDQQGRIILARHGHKGPLATELEGFLKEPLVEGSLDAARVAVYSAERDPNATSHTGTVLGWSPISKFGMRVRMTVNTQTLGNKLLFQWQGFKALLAPRPKHIKLPTAPNGDPLPLVGNLSANGIVSRNDITSKQSVGDTATSFQNAFWIFGVNFLPDVAASLGVTEDVARDILLAVADMPKITVEDAHYINTGGRATVDVLESLTSVFEGLEQSVSTAKIADPVSYQDQITTAMIAYLMTPGASVDAVLRSGSVGSPSADPNARAVRMPELFTQIFDLAPLNSELRREMTKRFQAKLPMAPNGQGYFLHPDLTIEVRNSDDPGDWFDAYLQVPEVHASGDNPAFNDMSYDPDQKSKYSYSAEAMVEQALSGTRIAQVNKLTAFTDFVSGKAVTERQSSLAQDGGVWRMLTGIKRDDGRSAVWRTWMPLEATYLTNGAEQAMVQFRQELEREGWSEKERTDYERAALEVINRLGLKRSQITLVDYWVRQMGGRWKDVLEPGPNNELTGKAAVEYVGYVLKNVQDGYFPTLGAEVPGMHLADVQLIFRANREGHVWQPRESIDRAKAKTADFADWDAWAKIALGSILTADHLFHPMYLTALDGFLHTWEHALPGLSDLPVSLDVIRAAGLMDPDNNRMLVSLSPQRNERFKAAPLLGADASTLEEILGGKLISGRFAHEQVPNSEIAKHRAQRRKWAKENDVPLMVDVSLKDLKANGIRMMSEASNTSSLMRLLINLRVGTALLNPMLYVSMGPEQWVRGSLDRTANLLTGQSTVGMSGKAAAKLHVSTFTPAQLKELDTIYTEMGKDTQFRFSVWEALDFLNPVQHGQSRVLRWSEKYARMGAMIQDPTRGMPPKTLARRYVEAALQIVAADPMKYGMSRDALIARLSTDPNYIEKNMTEVHQMASNAVAQIRSLKSTPLSLAVRAIYEPFSTSNHAGYNFFGNLVLKLPLIFSTYAFNVATTITGMQGFSDFTAAFVDGRNKGFIGRIQAGIKGEPVKTQIDMSEVLEGIDLSRSFIRGGLTHTGLFVAGMMASGLGLSGEDDETKKRRKLAALYGIHQVMDPTKLQNDFRNKDAIFLDSIPFLNSLFQVPDGEGGYRSVAQMPWLFKQFFSPVIGIERFFETGDFDNVRAGFADAVGSFPLINTAMWADAVETAHVLQNLGKEQEEYGREENLQNAMWFLTNAVGMYEKMLFENSFVNEIYVAMDRYDRNPYILPLRDSDGELQRDIEGNVRPNDVALESFIDPDTGEVMEGYQGRNDASATLHALTENRATLAFVSSLFTGGPADSDFNRYNMPQKLRTMDADVSTTEEAKAIITAAMQGAAYQGKGLENLSYEEILGELKSTYAEAGNWDAYNNVDVEAKRIYQSQNNQPMALSILDDDGYEVLTEAGAFAVVEGLAKGSVQLGDQSLAGIHITFETREAIQKQWMAELKQEGIDMGLSESEAMKRVNRLWYGPTEDPSIPGIKDYLWSDQISYDKTITYKQLNTTYVQGPDGRPWATGFRRDNLFNFTSILPLNAAFISEQGGMDVDTRMNSTDVINGINTGLRSLERVDKSSYIPTDKEIGDAIVKAIEELGSSTNTPFTPYKTNSASGGGYGGGSYGGGGSPFYSKMFAPPGGTTTYVDPLPNINTSNPYLRRANVRRERVWSEKGRLKQWQ